MPLPLRREGLNTFWPEELATWQRISQWPFLLTLSAGQLCHMDRNTFLPEPSLWAPSHGDWEIAFPFWLRRKTLHGSGVRNHKNRPRKWVLSTLKAPRAAGFVVTPPGGETLGLWWDFSPYHTWSLGNALPLNPADTFSELQDPLSMVKGKFRKVLHPATLCTIDCPNLSFKLKTGTTAYLWVVLGGMLFGEYIIRCKI